MKYFTLSKISADLVNFSAWVDTYYDYCVRFVPRHLCKLEVLGSLQFRLERVDIVDAEARNLSYFVYLEYFENSRYSCIMYNITLTENEY